MAKIKEIEPGRFLSKDNMNVVKGGETCSPKYSFPYNC